MKQNVFKSVIEMAEDGEEVKKKKKNRRKKHRKKKCACGCHEAEEPLCVACRCNSITLADYIAKEQPLQKTGDQALALGDSSAQAELLLSAVPSLPTSNSASRQPYSLEALLRTSGSMSEILHKVATGTRNARKKARAAISALDERKKVGGLGVV